MAGGEEGSQVGGRPRGQGPVRAVPPRARAAGNMLQAVRVKYVRECARKSVSGRLGK